MSIDVTTTRAAVIGAGLMGHGIAQVLAVAGVTVAVHDPDGAILQSVPARVADNLAALGLDPELAERIELVVDLESAVAGADWVFEAVPERLELKQQLFERLDLLAPPEAVLATNTSVIAIGDVAARVRGRHRVLGVHWWNPPYLIPLVEVVQAADTAPGVVERALDYLAALGKTPVHVRKDIPGFVGNRLQHALWRAAFQLIDDGVCDAETVDTVVKSGFGLRLPVLGPVENADLVGLDLTLDIHAYLLPKLDPPSEPSPGLRMRVERGELGMRSGAGFRTWTAEEAEELRCALRDHLINASREHDARTTSP